VISAVFLPLSLIAGIYGMNFADMPELHFKYGYEVIVGFMIAVAAGALFYFSRTGWFR
jgi:magnesium transporter